jgi:hypothetical protein
MEFSKQTPSVDVMEVPAAYAPLSDGVCYFRLTKKIDDYPSNAIQWRNNLRLRL